MSNDKSPSEMSIDELTEKAKSIDVKLMVNETIAQVESLIEQKCLHPFAVVYGYLKSEKKWGNSIFPIMMDITPENTGRIFMEIGKMCYEQGFYPFGVCFASKGKCLKVQREDLPSEDMPTKEAVDLILNHEKTENVLIVTASSIDNRHHAALASISDDDSLGEFDHEEGGERETSMCSEVFVGYAMAKLLGKIGGDPTDTKSRIPTPSVN